jgi:hypothetical protein
MKGYFPEGGTTELDLFYKKALLPHSEFNIDQRKEHYSDLYVGIKDGEDILPIIFYIGETPYYLTVGLFVGIMVKGCIPDDFKIENGIICRFRQMRIS